ncbi:protocadherin-like protein [Mercenaria mercenaria]|uniref:protocadherin-like protein n=1 Tax=Mercenaria mercenaria TaxID=6596 RepID=UPI00234FB267|nr:protocadherin-like protein [Mercenaria mercenaria]
MRKTSILTVIVLWTLIRPTDLAASVNIDPRTVNLNENDDSGISLATVSATCYPSTNDYINVTGVQTFNGTTTQHNVTCEACRLSVDRETDLFSFNMSDNTVYKSPCSATSCGVCPSCMACSTSNGCLTGPATYNIVVYCETTSYDNNDNGTSTLTVSVAEETPTLTISLPDSVPANNLMSVGTVLTQANQSSTSGPAIVEYTNSLAVSNTYELDTANMFKLNPTNGEVYVATDPSVEYDNTYSMGICIHSRRQTSCKNLTINFDGCFQTPNCDDQTNTSFSDQIAIGATLFTMNYTNPSAHFAANSSTWQNLNFVKVSSTLAEASIDLTSGVISTTGNVTVWPDYPYSTHTFVVRVSNPGYSCSYTATCTMTMQFSFTNWPIRFESLPNTTYIHEDTDDRTLVHSIITYDPNNPDHDNVTCNVTANDDTTLLELTHNGNYDYDSWFIYKKECNEPNCGCIDENFLCDKDIGCLNYNLNNTYTITIQCSDAYGSSDEETFTLQVTENQPPSFTNTPTNITLNTDNVAHLDSVFSIYYSDAESETLDYNFTITPDTPSLFKFDTWGNYYDNPCNVTATSFQWNQTNNTFAVSFCGRERRNMVCSSFNIYIRDYCGPTPVCSHNSTTVTDQFAIGGELFQIDVTGSGYTSLTYSITSEYSNLFSVDPLTGIVTSAAALEARSPPGSTSYSMVAKVYDTAACAHAACALSVEVTYTNFNISIDNMGSVNVDIHEDEQASVTLVTIATSDNNTNDGVTCEVDNAASTPANNSIFFAVETNTRSNVYELVSKEGPGFDYDVADTYIVVVVCEDNYGSSDTATATVSILENQVPTMDNLNAGKVINVDPITVGDGDVIFTLQTSDNENDPLVYSCSVTNNFVPLQCLSDGVVSLRRNVRIPDEEGEMYNVTLCIEDSAHNHTVCETLNVNISSSKTNPVLDNLPSSVSFYENTTIGATLFNVTVEDPDVLDVYTFSMVVYPKTSSSAFSLDANTGVLTLQESLDYETLNHYEFLFRVRDAYLPGLEDKYLSLSVLDVNEAPSLTLTETTYATIEEDAGYTVATLIFTCTDVDVGQTTSLAITSGTDMSYFSLDSSTGVMTFAQNWDFENGVVPPQTTSLEITCDDGNGLSDAGTIVVNIAAVNEFSPSLSTTAEDITIYSNQTLIDPLFTVTATDNDYGDDGLFDFSIIGEGKGSKYFTISSTGQLFISDYIDWNYDYTFEFTIKVSDGESNPRASHVNVIVRYITSFEPTIPTKERARCILCTNIGKAVVSSLCVEAVIILLLFIHMCCRMKPYRVCQLKPKPKLRNASDIKKAIQDRSDTDDPYRPGSEMLNRALPDDRPPSPFMYNVPPRLRGEPPAAAEYIEPGPAISLAHISGPPKPSSVGIKRKRVTNIKPKAKHIPSLFQNKAYAPTRIALPRSVDETFTKEQLTQPDVSNKRATISPLFGRSNGSKLYSENQRHLPDIEEPDIALDF